MTLWYCDVLDCANPAVRNGGCLLRKKRFCVVHFHAAISHTCPTLKDDRKKWAVDYRAATRAEITGLISRIDLEALTLRASSLRGGVPCKVLPEDARGLGRMGGRHYHISMVFPDGITWIARIFRDNVSLPPASHLNFIILNEVATLRFLSTTTKVPVPAVHDFAIEGPGNAVGLGYILMDQIHGHPLDLKKATLLQQRRILNQFADIFIELEQHPFDSIGSLCDPKTGTIGGCTEDEMADLDGQGNLRLFGPFKNNMSYLEAKVNLRLELIKRREAHATHPVDAYLVHRYLTDTLLQSKRAEDNSQPPFYLKHMDDKGDHILVDDDFNITGIVDWEWAQTVSKADAFCSPLFLLDVASFYDGENHLSEYEEVFAEILQSKGRYDLAELVRNSRLQHRILFTVCGHIDSHFFTKLFEGFLKLQPGRGHKSVLWDDWKAESLTRYADEPDLLRLIKEENGRKKAT